MCLHMSVRGPVCVTCVFAHVGLFVHVSLCVCPRGACVRAAGPRLGARARRNARGAGGALRVQRGPRGRGGAGRERPLRLVDLAFTCGGRGESREQKGEGRGAGLRARRAAGVRAAGWPAMGASRGRGGLAALWCLGLLGGLARVAGTHYRYLWRGCYPCHLGQAGHSVSAGDRRPGGRRADSARVWGGGAGAPLRREFPLHLFLKLAAQAADRAEAGGSRAAAVPLAAASSGTGPFLPESSDLLSPLWSGCGVC